MKICEGCIKQDACKFKKEVEEYEPKGTDMPEPLVPDLLCKYKDIGQPNWHYSVPCSNGTTCNPDVTIYNPYPPSYTTWSVDGSKIGDAPLMAIWNDYGWCELVYSAWKH